MAILIKKAGVLSSIQDLGRFGSRRLGINPNGVMDAAAARLINIAVGNDENTAVIELHFPGPMIEFLDETTFAIGGADLGARLDGVSIDPWRVYQASERTVISFDEKRSGHRAYLTVKGGMQIDEWLHSSSTNLVANVGGFQGRELGAGDRIECHPSSIDRSLVIGRSLIPRYSRFPTVRVVPGAEFDLLTAISERGFLNNSFKITANSNRMGFRLEGEPLHLLHKKELLSSAVDFGTIQLLPDGQMILLMADHQTTGGYPRIAHVIKHDLPLAAQLGPNDTLSFHLVSLEQAEALTMMFERDLAFFRMGIKFRHN